MIILKNHYNDLNTYIVGGYIILGHHIFHISHIDLLCKEYHISDCVKKGVMRAYRANNKTPEDWDMLVKHSDKLVRLLIVLTRDPRLCSLLVNDPEWLIRLAIARTGNPELCRILINDEDIAVVEAVAETADSSICSLLVNNPEDSVRLAVARRGIPELCTLLVNDVDSDIREEALKHIGKYSLSEDAEDIHPGNGGKLNIGRGLTSSVFHLD